MRRGPDAGSFAIEAAIIAPVVVLFVLIVVVVGRIQTTGGVVDAAARAGARAASLARTQEGAQQAAEQAAREVLTQQHVPCTDESVSPVVFDPAGADAQPETVSITVTCTVSLGHLTVDGAPGSKTMVGEFTSVVDRYRGTG